MTQTPPTPAVRTRTRPAPQRQLDVSGSQEGYLEVTRTRYGSEPERLVAEKIFVPTFPTAPAHVGMKISETINMGDFNSVRVEVSLHLPVLPEMTEIERVKNMASDVLDRWMEVETKRATGAEWETPSQ